MFKKFYNVTIGWAINPIIDAYQKYKKDKREKEKFQEKAIKRDIALNHEVYNKSEKALRQTKIKLEEIKSELSEERKVNKTLENNVRSSDEKFRKTEQYSFDLEEKLKKSELNLASNQGNLKRQKDLYKMKERELTRAYDSHEETKRQLAESRRRYNKIADKFRQLTNAWKKYSVPGFVKGAIKGPKILYNKLKKPKQKKEPLPDTPPEPNPT